MTDLFGELATDESWIPGLESKQPSFHRILVYDNLSIIGHLHKGYDLMDLATRVHGFRIKTVDGKAYLSRYFPET